MINKQRICSYVRLRLEETPWNNSVEQSIKIRNQTIRHNIINKQKNLLYARLGLSCVNVRKKSAEQFRRTISRNNSMVRRIPRNNSTEQYCSVTIPQAPAAVGWKNLTKRRIFKKTDSKLGLFKENYTFKQKYIFPQKVQNSAKNR